MLHRTIRQAASTLYVGYTDAAPRMELRAFRMTRWMGVRPSSRRKPPRGAVVNIPPLVKLPIYPESLSGHYSHTVFSALRPPAFSADCLSFAYPRRLPSRLRCRTLFTYGRTQPSVTGSPRVTTTPPSSGERITRLLPDSHRTALCRHERDDSPPIVGCYPTGQLQQLQVPPVPSISVPERARNVHFRAAQFQAEVSQLALLPPLTRR